jgi:hypothetical protein
MSETVVPYQRFLEIRQRRERVTAELTKQPFAPAAGDAFRGPQGPARSGTMIGDHQAVRRETTSPVRN